ncbi:AraC family transcriptional regulator [Morganella morganii]|uniref:AraC family transcriptional regulator n=2 Tax=Morganella morganii TaxID=582 RepID=UPI00128DB211|nr:helix-turn-helix transcriptional regulator [Morganella morganii]MQC05779.1 AraC family transcriptional regulator [Morganella morganii]MQC13554.1 AraC family transcriptional regulator [Morganella morganii]HCR3444756.1 helix-turn-helix transcriptional regulator [Morganella morganii]
MAHKSDISSLGVKDPVTLICRHEQFYSETEFALHHHPFGQLLYVASGVMEMTVEGQRYLAPAGFCIWIPPGTEHASYNKACASFKIIDISPQWAPQLPQMACVIELTPVFSAVMQDLFGRKVREPETDADRRLALVLTDQLLLSPCQPTYLPVTDDKLLAPVLSALENDPSDNTSLAEWAVRRFTSERTLSRRCQQKLGMSFSEWRQRLRFLRAVALLQEGRSVQNVALDVGYSSSSAFIAMFSQLAGVTPERFRHQP